MPPKAGHETHEGEGSGGQQSGSKFAPSTSVVAQPPAPRYFLTASEGSFSSSSPCAPAKP
jgi:hypothetical protein